MAKRKKRKKRQAKSDFVRAALDRLLAAPQFFTTEQRAAIDSYDGPVVSGDPEGRLPTNLDADGKKEHDRLLTKSTWQR